MTTQEFLAEITTEDYSAETQQKLRALIGDATEISPELAAQISEYLEDDLDNDLKDVEVDPIAAAALEQELTLELAKIEETVKDNYEIIEKNLQELSEMSQKVDVLERLHPNAA